ncbi:STRA6 protein, partial [Myiagra hebetior]|nr:STRA6 protein [Myiagra hebetior]
PLSQLAVILALSFLVKRRRLHLSCWNGIPGLLSPANFLEEESSRGPAVAVFGILFSSLCQLVLDKDPLPLAGPSSHSAREYWKILALLYYPAFYFPLLACATSRHRLGYLAGSLLAWGHCLVHVWQKVECPHSPKIHRLYSLLSHVPTVLALLLLSLWYPALLGRSLRTDSPEQEIPGSGYYRKYLKAVLSKRGWKGSSVKIEESLQSRIRSYLRSYIYTPEEGFRIPLKLVVSLAMAVIAVYQVALLLLLTFVPTIRIVRAGMTKDIVVLLVQFGLVPSDNPAMPGDMEKELGTVRHYLWSLEVCYICSLVLCCLLTCAMLLRTLGTHRSNLRALYQGAVLDVFSEPHALRPSRGALVCWMSFSSFQAAFACLGLLIQQVIFFLCSVAFAFLVVIPLQAGTGSLLFGIMRNMWGSCGTSGDLVGPQGTSRDLRKPQRTSGLSLLSLLFLLGSRKADLAAPLGPGVGMGHTVPAERAVPAGYHSYCHFLKVEVSQGHPLVKAFCFLLLQRPELPALPRDTRLEEGLHLMHHKQLAPGKARIRRIRARWWLLYPLLHNPSLSASRKTALADPAANGAQLGVPAP